MQRYQPAEQVRNGIPMFGIVDTELNTILPHEFWFTDHGIRNEVVASLNRPNAYDRWRALAAQIPEHSLRKLVRSIIDSGARNAYDTICVEHARPFTRWDDILEGSMVTVMSERHYRDVALQDQACGWFESHGLRI